MLWSHNFFGNEKIFISKKITRVGSSAFQKTGSDQHLYLIFLTFFEKKKNNWIKFKLPKSRIKWTGLLSPVHPNYNRSFLIWSKFQGLAQKLKDQPFTAAAKDFKSGIPFKKSFLDFWLFLDPASLISRNLLDTV